MKYDILAHRLRAIILKLINRADGRIELIEQDDQQFVQFDNQITGRSIQVYAGAVETDDGDVGLVEFAGLIVELETGINRKGTCKEEMLALAEFVPANKRAKWLSIWE